MKKWINILLFSVLILGACKTKENLTKENQIKDVKFPSLDKLKLQAPAIKTANFSKLMVEVDFYGNYYTSHASMKIIRDSIIQVSIQPMLGIEIARLNFYENEFVIIDKINGRYLKAGYDSLLTRYKINIDYNSLQAVLLNELFIMGEPSEPFDSLTNKFTKSAFPEGILLRSSSSKALAPSEFIVNEQNNINYTSITMPLLLTTARYTDFSKINDIEFPLSWKFSILEGPKSKTAKISIQVVEFNTLVKINSSNLSNYEQVNTFEQIIP